MKCLACNGVIAEKEKHLKCIVCSGAYHIMCLNVNKTQYEKHMEEFIRSWSCPHCQAKVNTAARRNRHSDTPVRQSLCMDEGNMSCDDINDAVGRHEDMSTQPVTVYNKPHPSERRLEGSNRDSTAIVRDEVLVIIREELRSMLRDVVSAELRPVREEIREIQKSLSFILEEHTSLKRQLDNTNADNAVLNERCGTLEVRLAGLERDIIQQQQWARLQNLEIQGVPEETAESLPDVITKLADHIGVPLLPDEIEFVHRVQPRRSISGRPRSIVLRLRQRATKDKLLSAARACRDLSAAVVGVGGAKSGVYVYINEHLTQLNKTLLRDCKSKARQCSYKFVWTKNCRIYVRKSEKTPPILIASDVDLKKIA